MIISGRTGVHCIRPQGRNLKLNEYNIDLLGTRKPHTNAWAPIGQHKAHDFCPASRPVTAFYDRMLFPTKTWNLRQDGFGTSSDRRSSLPPAWRQGQGTSSGVNVIGRGGAAANFKPFKF